MSANLNPALLEALASGGGSAAATQALLAQLGEADPTVSALATYLARRQAEARESEQTVEEEEEAAECSGELEQSRARAAEMAKALGELRRQVEDMYAELQELRERNDILAAALGACHLCWGADWQCQFCAGRGGPGFYLPERELFIKFVRPASHRLRQTEGVGRGFRRNAAAHLSSGSAQLKGENDER